MGGQVHGRTRLRPLKQTHRPQLQQMPPTTNPAGPKPGEAPKLAADGSMQTNLQHQRRRTAPSAACCSQVTSGTSPTTVRNAPPGSEDGHARLTKRASRPPLGIWTAVRIPVVNLQDHATVRQQLLILEPTVRAREARRSLVPAAAGLNITHTDKRLRIHGSARRAGATVTTNVSAWRRGALAAPAAAIGWAFLAEGLGVGQEANAAAPHTADATDAAVRT